MGEGCRRLLGHRAQDIVGHPVQQLLTASAEIASWPPAPGALDRGGDRQSVAGVVEVTHAEGRSLRLTVEIIALSGEDGARCWFVAVTDAPDGAENVEAAASLLDRSTLAVGVWDADMRLVWSNRTCREVVSLFEANAPTPSTRHAMRGFDRTTIEPVLRKVLRSKEPVTESLVRWVSPEDGREIVSSSSVFPLAPGAGSPLGVCTISLVTKSGERERLALLGRAARRIGTTLDVVRTAQELADIAVPTLADYVTVDLADAVPLGGEPLERLPEAESGVPVFRRAGLASVHGGKPEAAFTVGDVVYVPPRLRS